ncbi:MAG TPA: hypothetical protein VH722_19065 [Alphaproteobacteria bacterium]|jgi:hypothetical protein|nr:hypothetical protein [Alphaproteobacteria bacterium]
MRSTLPLAVVFAVASAIGAHAAGDHIGRTALVVGDDGTEVQQQFAADTPKIVLHVELKGAEPGAKIEGAWIAVKTDVAPPNYKIDAATVTADNGQDEATFALSKPDAGWPVGSYQVQLTYDGAVEKTVPFTVK